MIDRSCRRDALRQTASMTPPPAQNGTSGACPALLRRLQALDFSIVETALYLDAYPNSSEALAFYRALVRERDALKHSLATDCHAPITHFENEGNTWDWINGPWPWEASAN